MRDELRRLFDAKHRLAVDAAGRLTGEDLDDLEGMVRGSQPVPDLSRALQLLVTAAPDRGRELAAAVATDRRRPTADRVVAVHNLTRGAGPAAQATLRRLALDDELLVRIAAIRDLGRVGTADALDVLTRASRAPEEPLRRLAVLSAALVAFRENIEGHEPLLAEPRPSTEVRWQTDIAMEGIEPEAARSVVGQAEMSGYGLQPGIEAGVRLECGRQQLALIPAQNLVSGGSLVHPGSARQLAAVVATQAEADRSWATSHLVLTWPSDDHLEIGIFRTDGRPVFGGTWRAEGRFEVVGLRGGGNFSVEVVGRTGEEGIVLERGRSGSTGDRRQPQPARGL